MLDKPASICSRNRKKVAGLAFLIFFIVFLVYANSLGNDFIWDDEYLILNNPQVKSFSHFWDVFRTYVGYGSENVNNFYRPLQEISNMIDYFLWGEDAAGFHLTNILLHSFVAVLVFIFIFYLCKNISIAILCGIFYGVHPIHTEAVTYIAGRADPLYSVFFLSSLTFFIRYANHTVKGDKRPVFLVLANVFFVCALLSKEISMVLPLLIMLYIYVILKGTVPRAVYNRLKNLWIPSSAIASVYVFLRLTVLDFSKIAPPVVFSRIPFPNRISTFFKAVLVYLRLLVLPLDLHMERSIGITKYPLEPASLTSFLTILSLIALGAALYKRRGKIGRLISFFIFWFFINLLPVSNIYPINSFIAEHWVYMASVGYFFIFSYLIHELYMKSRTRVLAKICSTSLIAILLIGYSLLTAARNRDWKDEANFFENTLKYSPGNARLYLNFGNTYFERGNLDKAIEKYKKAISIQNNYAEAYGNIGAVYISKRDLTEAESYLKKAIEIKFNYPIAHYSLGAVYYNLGKTEDAINELEISIKQMPHHYPSLNLLGEIFARQGNKEKAVELLRESLQIKPGQKDVENLLKRSGL